MNLFSLRSLLLAAIVLCNCLTWAVSRYRYTHNISRHGSRYKRQGVRFIFSRAHVPTGEGEEVPSSTVAPQGYILPRGEGGGWGEWWELSSCSRTCGGGVASQKRICLQLGPDGQPQCPGGDTKYISCQTQDCPAGSKDYRAVQCSEFDDVTFKNITKYTWIPYKNSAYPCELNCKPPGERFFYRHRPKVADGTRCNDESFDVCIDGACQPVGCDMMLGSSAREDKCRVCRGNGANCQTISEFLDKENLSTDSATAYVMSYYDMLLIPEGATSIVIEEVVPSQNYLALRATNGTYYLNGHYQIDYSRTLVFAGASWTYKQGEEIPEEIHCLGPTTEPVYLALLTKKTYAFVKYEYSVPRAT